MYRRRSRRKPRCDVIQLSYELPGGLVLQWAILRACELSGFSTSIHKHSRLPLTVQVEDNGGERYRDCETPVSGRV
jgi:hypothetical protein